MQKKDLFIGRQKELEELTSLFSKQSASFVVVKGRRRIGKSRLIQEFGKKYTFLQFVGSMPTAQETPQSQRDLFARQLSAQTDLPILKTESWDQLFHLLAEKTKKGKVVILFDEISWMGAKDPDFLAHLKTAWDIHFKNNPQLILVLCGSVSTWIEKNILSSTGFMGRLSLRINLQEFSLSESNLFLDKIGYRGTFHDRFKILCVTGGIPRYLEEIQPGLSADENIRRLCFTSNGILYTEFGDIFSDLFMKKSDNYRKIIETLLLGNADYNDICEKLNMPKSGNVSEYLENLLQSGFISRDYTWHLQNGKEGRLSLFRLSDNYIRFYLKYIAPNKGRIEKGHFETTAPSKLTEWNTIMGLQLENLILRNRPPLWRKLGIFPEEIIADNPYFQRPTTRTPGCQIDYLIQTHMNNLYVCEVKFSKNPIGMSIVEEMEEKLRRFKTPKNFARHPVLIHVNGITEELADCRYFSNIICLSDLI